MESVFDDNPTHINLFLQNLAFVAESGSIRVQRHMKAASNVEYLELKCCELGSVGCRHITKAVMNYGALKHLGVARNNIRSEAAVDLVKALRTTNIESVDLSGNTFLDDVGHALGDLLMSSSTVKTILLEKCMLNTPGIKSMADALCTNTSLTNLNLGWNRTQNDGCVAFKATLAANSTLLTLNLTANNILSDGFRTLAQGLAKNTTLQSLIIQQNYVMDGADVLGQAIAHTNLRELNFSSNRLPHSKAEKFSDGLGTNRTLIAVNFAKCSLGPYTFPHIAEAILKIATMQLVDLRSCSLNAECATGVNNILTCCPNLHSLLLDYNDELGDTGIKAMTEGLAAAPSLTSLSVSRCSLSNKGAAAIGSALQNKVGLRLTELYIASNSIGNDGTAKLCHMIGKFHPTIKSLDISGNGVTHWVVKSFETLFMDCPALHAVTIRDNPFAIAVESNFFTRETLNQWNDDVEALTRKEEGRLKQIGVKADKVPDTQQLEIIESVTGKNPPRVNPYASMHVTSTRTPPFELPLSPVVVSEGAAAAAQQQSSTGTAPSSTTKASPRDFVARPRLSEFDEEAANATERSGERAADEAADQQRQALSTALAKASYGAFKLVPNVDFKSPVAETIVGAVQENEVPLYPRARLDQPDDNIQGFDITEDQLRFRFQTLDVNGNGYLEESEFKQMYECFDNFGMELPQEQLDRICAPYMKDGKVFFNEFCILMLKLVGR